MELSLEQQASVASLDALDVRPGTGGPQPFRVPGDCHERFHQLPRSCVARCRNWNASLTGGAPTASSKVVLRFPPNDVVEV